jgi:hypothetical protein
MWLAPACSRERTRREFSPGSGRCAATSSDPTIAARHGRVVKRTGDGIIIEFRSVVDAVRCAIEVQSGMWLSFVRINSNRAAQGIADAERALALNRNLPRALRGVGTYRIPKMMAARVTSAR